MKNNKTYSGALIGDLDFSQVAYKDRLYFGEKTPVCVARFGDEIVECIPSEKNFEQGILYYRNGFIIGLNMRFVSPKDSVFEHYNRELAYIEGME